MKRIKKKFRKVCLLTLFFGGIVLMMIPPVTFMDGEKENKEIVKQLKEKKDCTKKDKIATSQQKKDTEEKQELPEGLLGYLTIRKINAEYPIVEGASREVLAYYIGHLPETAALGEVGNCVLAGHRGGKNGLFFKELDKLLDGDIVEITDITGKNYIYVVSESWVTEPENQTVKAQGKQSVLTLITCTDNGTKRLIVLCEKGEVSLN